MTDVRVTENLRDASVYVMAEGTETEKTEAMKALQKAAPYVRRQFGIALNLRFTPELHFVRDTVEEARRARRGAALRDQDGKPDRPPPPQQKKGPAKKERMQ